MVAMPFRKRESRATSCSASVAVLAAAMNSLATCAERLPGPQAMQDSGLFAPLRDVLQQGTFGSWVDVLAWLQANCRNASGTVWLSCPQDRPLVAFETCRLGAEDEAYNRDVEAVVRKGMPELFFEDCVDPGSPVSTGGRRLGSGDVSTLHETEPPSAAPTRMPTAQPPPQVYLALLIDGIDYGVLEADENLSNSFKSAIADSVAAEANLTRNNVTVQLSAGSVAADTTITPPRGTDVHALASSLTASSDLPNGVRSNISSVDGIGSATTGAIEVHLQSPASAQTSSPTRSPTVSPTPGPTAEPTPAPTHAPTIAPPPPTVAPTPGPTQAPTVPTLVPTFEPTVEPTAVPTPGPTAPTASPSPVPTHEPTPPPTRHPTPIPFETIGALEHIHVAIANNSRMLYATYSLPHYDGYQEILPMQQVQRWRFDEAGNVISVRPWRGISYVSGLCCANQAMLSQAT